MTARTDPTMSGAFDPRKRALRDSGTRRVLSGLSAAQLRDIGFEVSDVTEGPSVRVRASVMTGLMAMR